MRSLLVGTSVVFFFGAMSSVFAASPGTDAFVANVRLNALFVVESGKLAADRSENGALQSFANRETDAQGSVLVAIDTKTAPDIAQVLPMAIAANDVVTGRSAAVTPDVSTAYDAPAGSGAMMPAAMVTLDHLSSAKGEAFDTLYKATQINALRQMAALYNAYSMTGDDDGLRQMARTELAATDRAIAEIARF